ncbi:MAG: 30S ribosomal protein S13 [Sulfolobales archaeon]|nr:30S ribosomal protein S13 [Sulfolobales archaeon]MCX8208827.1 30S ribosomal protein S13 [Sulfolobales archaeon]MDW8010148.1 30S ribosomal protein S13 [Sulfolobales archaeon]
MSFKHIVRIAGVDIEGELSLVHGLSKIKGVGPQIARACALKLGLNPKTKIGYLSDEDVERIEDFLRDPVKYGVPPWMVNRRKDYETGLDRHLIGSDLILAARQDIEREIKIRSWRGVRHSLGLKVRGQRTHTTGRVGPVVGVTKGKTKQ